MNHFGFNITIKNAPELDPGFIPLFKFNEAFLKNAEKPIAIAIERNDKQIFVMETFIHNDKKYTEANRFYIDRLVKFYLWQTGGFRIFINGCDDIYHYLKDAYSQGGAREFDCEFFGNLYEQKFEVLKCDDIPEPYEIKRLVGGHWGGCRIGFDAGGSDNKVAAVIDGKTVYSKETVWNPKVNENPDYHYNGILAAFRDAAAHMPHVDAIGISSAGLIGNNRILYAQLFQKVPKELFDSKGRETYIRAVKEIGGDIPFEVYNDGDVAALAGAISLKRKNLLGLALGTSFIGGFVDKDGNLSNRISELAFAPVDVSPNAAKDAWTQDIGVGVQYFCQEAVIKLAPAAGITLDEFETPAKKLKAVQDLLSTGHRGAALVFQSIGSYLGHTVPFYYDVYGADTFLLLGRVVSGMGGDIIIKTATDILSEEYPDVSVELMLPDEHTRRLGQSVAAASLPKI